MANFVYDKALEAFGKGQINFSSDTIKVQLVDKTQYTASQSADQYFSTLASGAKVGTAVALSGMTVTGGVFKASNVTFTALSGANVTAFVVYKDTGDSATSPLILYMDTGYNFPLSPLGVDTELHWPTSGIFKI